METKAIWNNIMHSECLVLPVSVPPNISLLWKFKQDTLFGIICITWGRRIQASTDIVISVGVNSQCSY